MPRKASEVDTNEPFTPDELLYRRIASSELNTKDELDPTRFNSISFGSTYEGAPSVNRSKFSQPQDVIHSDCAGQKDVSDWLIYFISVDSIPTNIESGDKRIFTFFPIHVPLETCGSHSVITSALADDEKRNFMKPSKAVVNDLRVKLATRLLPITQTFYVTTRQPAR